MIFSCIIAKVSDLPINELVVYAAEVIADVSLLIGNDKK
jgi:hypothetical protein